mgnify:CR=1 FL=1
MAASTEFSLQNPGLSSQQKLFYSGLWTLGGVPPPNPLLPWGGEGPPDPPPGQGLPDPPCAQARMVRTAREHEVIMARNMMSNHTDMQDTYCGYSNVTHPTQSQYKGKQKEVTRPYVPATSSVVAANGRHLCIGVE